MDMEWISQLSMPGLLQNHGKVFPRGHPRGKGMARFMRQYVHVVGRAR